MDTKDDGGPTDLVERARAAVEGVTDKLVHDLRQESLAAQQIAWGRRDGGQDYAIAAQMADAAADRIEAQADEIERLRAELERLKGGRE